MITKEKNRTKIICAVVTAISAIVAGGSAFQLYNVQNISQTVNGNVIQILGETGSYVSAGTDLTDSTDELISAYRKVLDENSQYQANQSTLQGQVQSLQNENDDLKNQIQILKGTLLNTYSSDEINSVIEQGGLKRDISKRLDNLECLDSVHCEQVPSVKDIDDVNMMSLKYALTDKAKVSLKPEDGNSLFQILDNGLQISTGLTVLLGKRSSGKTYTLDQINAQFPGGKYIKQFSLLSTDDEQSQRKFEAALKNRGNSVTESYLGPFKTVVDDVQSVNLEQDAKEIDEYLETLKKAGEDAQRQDIFSKANLYQESNFSIKNLSSLVEMIEAVETLLGSIEYKELVEKYVGRRSLLRLAIALREQYIQEKTDSLHKEYVNSLITSVKKELSVRSSTTAVPDIDLYQILMNQHKVQVFHDVVKMIKKPRVIQAQNLYSYRVVAQSSPFSGALAMQKVSRSKTVFSDAFKEYNDPYKFLQVLKGKDIPASEYYKYFVNITYEVFNQYGSPASGGERSEYNLLQELSDGVKNSILILDEPESSFDNIFLRDGVDSLLKDISKTIPVIIATHNNTIGVSVHPDYIVYACKEVLSDGKLEYHLYSGYPSSEDLVDLKGNHISRKSVLLDCLEAGEAAYMDRRNSYEILNG